MSERKQEITPEDISFIASKVGVDKFLKRAEQFTDWINRFIDSANKHGSWPATTQLMNNMSAQEMGVYLNFFYWHMMEDFVRPMLKIQESNKPVIINHYKIAATIEFIIMTYLPFENEKGEPIKELNADFAFHISLQILFCWNIHKEKISPEAMKELLTNDEPTREFIKEHKKWLQAHAIAINFVIFSNMQTLRLFHYWFRDPQEAVKPF